MGRPRKAPPAPLVNQKLANRNLASPQPRAVGRTNPSNLSVSPSEPGARQPITRGWRSDSSKIPVPLQQAKGLPAISGWGYGLPAKNLVVLQRTGSISAHNPVVGVAPHRTIPLPLQQAGGLPAHKPREVVRTTPIKKSSSPSATRGFPAHNLVVGVESHLKLLVFPLEQAGACQPITRVAGVAPHPKLLPSPSASRRLASLLAGGRAQRIPPDKSTTTLHPAG